jgi:hypothetical protein
VQDLRGYCLSGHRQKRTARSSSLQNRQQVWCAWSHSPARHGTPEMRAGTFGPDNGERRRASILMNCAIDPVGIKPSFTRCP